MLPAIALYAIAHSPKNADGSRQLQSIHPLGDSSRAIDGTDTIKALG